MVPSRRQYKHTSKKMYTVFTLNIGIALDKMFIFNTKVSIFFLFLQENICYGYSLEALAEVLLMRTNNVCFHREIRKIFT